MSSISVIIPAFRAHATIARAVRSVLEQERPADDILIVSDDGTDYAATLGAAGFADAPLRFASTGAVGAGPSAGRNVGLALAKSTLVAWLDADDIYHPARLRRLAPLALDHGAAGDNSRVVDDETGRTLATHFPERGSMLWLDAASFLALSVPIVCVVRRDLELRWEEDVRLGEDVAYNLKLFDRLVSFPVEDAPLRDYRVRHGSVCHAENSAALAEQGYTTMQRHLERDGFGLTRPALRALFADALAQKIAFNRAFERARLAGRVATFQEFVGMMQAEHA
ncbi:MAG: glycosyltransferase family 2 protein [Alphaproteobacteria bacterium]